MTSKLEKFLSKSVEMNNFREITKWFSGWPPRKFVPSCCSPNICVTVINQTLAENLIVALKLICNGTPLRRLIKSQSTDVFFNFKFYTENCLHLILMLVGSIKSATKSFSCLQGRVERST